MWGGALDLCREFKGMRSRWMAEAKAGSSRIVIYGALAANAASASA